MLGVLDHADNFVHQIVGWIVGEPDLLPSRICVAEIESGGGLVNDRYLGRGGVVAWRERASQQ